MTTATARPAPAWLTRSVMYQIHLRSFTPEGTLAAATAHLPRLAGLGVDVLYLTPICVQDDDPRPQFWSLRQRLSPFANPRNPYRIKDYDAIDPEYGNPADLHAFVTEAHRLGMRVLLDIVFFHCGPTAVFVDRHPGFVQRGPDGNLLTGDWCFPRLNFADPGLREHLLANLESWVRDFDVDGFRYDVSDAVPLDFWESVRPRLARLKAETIILGEGQRLADQVAAMDLNYNWTWTSAIHDMLNKDRPAHLLRGIWERMRAERPAGARFIRYLDNHDIAHDTGHGGHPQPDGRQPPREGLPLDRLDRAWGVPAVDSMLVLCFALDGMPFLYNGQEVADVERHSIYGRVPIAWARGATPEGGRRTALCRQLCILRHHEPALADGALTWLDHDRPDEVLAFTRTTTDQRLLVLINAKDRPVECAIALPGSAGLAPLLAEGAAANGLDGTGRRRIALAGHGYLVAAIR